MHLRGKNISFVKTNAYIALLKTTLQYVKVTKDRVLEPRCEFKFEVCARPQSQLAARAAACLLLQVLSV